MEPFNLQEEILRDLYEQLLNMFQEKFPGEIQVSSQINAKTNSMRSDQQQHTNLIDSYDFAFR